MGNEGFIRRSRTLLKEYRYSVRCVMTPPTFLPHLFKLHAFIIFTSTHAPHF